MHTFKWKGAVLHGDNDELELKTPITYKHCRRDQANKEGEKLEL